MILCVCNRITEQEVRDLARAGVRSPEAAYDALGCEPQCGACLCFAQELIDEERGHRPQLRVVGGRAA